MRGITRVRALPEILCPKTARWDLCSLDALNGVWANCARISLRENLSGRPPQWGTEVRLGWSGDVSPWSLPMSGSKSMGHKDKAGRRVVGRRSGGDFSGSVWGFTLLFRDRDQSSEYGDRSDHPTDLDRIEKRFQLEMRGAGYSLRHPGVWLGGSVSNSICVSGRLSSDALSGLAGELFAD